MPDGDGGADLMSAAELKPLLMQSKRKPVSCAVGLTKDKQGVLLLDRKVKPRKLMAELKSKAKSESIDLDTVSVRFGRVAVGADDGAAVFTVNKAAPAALRMKLVEKLRPAGVRKVEIGVDESLEDEGDEEGAEAGHGAGANGSAGMSAAAAGGAQTETGVAEAAPDNVAAADGAGGPVAVPTDGAGIGADMAAAPAGEGDAAATGPGPGPATGTPAKAGVARRLAGLVKQMAPGLASAPNADAMRAAAMAGHKAVQSGDLVGASEAADKLEGLLGGAKGETPLDARGEGAPSEDDAGASPAPRQAAAASDGTTGATGDGPVPEQKDGIGAGQPLVTPTRAPNGKLFSKGSDIWNAVRLKLEGDIHAVLAAVAAEPGVDEGMVGQIQAHIEPIIEQLDDSLAKKLAEIADIGDGGHGKLMKEAQEIMSRYRAFVDAEPMIGILDQNPIKPVAIRKTVDQALASLAKVLATAKASGSATPT